MQFYSRLYIFIIVIIALFCTILGLILYRMNRKNKCQVMDMLADFHKQNDHMDSTVRICEHALELTKEVIASIDSAQISRTENCIRKCEDIIDSVKAADTPAGILLHEKKQLCAEKCIRFEDKISFIPDDRQVRGTDTVSVLGNLIDNAIEAASADKRPGADRYVSLSSILRKNIWMIDIVNSISPEIKIDKSMDTTKADRQAHGHGLNIVRIIAHKYFGSVKMTDLNDSFEVKVYMVIKNVKD